MVKGLKTKNATGVFLMTRIFLTIIRGFANISEWVLFSMGLIIFYDVFLRYVFNRPTMWVLEISEYMLVFLAFAGAAEVQRQKRHIKMDFFYVKFPPGVRLCLDMLFSMLTAVFGMLLLWNSLKMTVAAFQYGSRSNSLLAVPLFIPYAIVPLGMCLLLLQSIADIINSAKEVRNQYLLKKKGSG